ncbi:MAG: helix-turn-helix transcriptional regulator [Proteobacteria bacterium]|nr:helix-turn-helix transcriptional regulator [Pseudomonadota bacterium]HQR04241.1 helix-turn-helix transcriptional regulator [Rhodocyclaceae bacterium]
MSRQLALLDVLFQSILETPPWQRFVEAFDAYLPCRHTSLLLRKPRTGDPGVVISATGVNTALQVYQTRTFDQSIFLHLPPGEVHVLREVMPEAELRKNGYYREYLQPFGVRDLIGTDWIDPATGLGFGLRGARMAGDPAFGERERSRFTDLLPRVRTAAALYARIEHQQYRLGVYEEAAGQAAVASLVINESGRVILHNMLAERVVAEADGLCLKNGRVCATDPAADVLLDRAIRDLALSMRRGEMVPGHKLLLDRGTGRQWRALLRPAVQGVAIGEDSSLAMSLLLRDAQARGSIGEGPLMELFGLTRAEARLAARLASGLGLKEAAAAIGISHHTARAQLSAVFAKTDTHRQSQLVSLVLGTTQDEKDK